MSQMKKKLLSQRHPALLWLCIWARRCERYARELFDGKKYAHVKSKASLTYLVKEHRSTLLRRLGDVDMQLQHNKVHNLHLAAPLIDGVLIRPGETFSFCRLVGLPSQRRGFLPGLELCNGEAKSGIGGGLCQIANLLHWMVLHSDLTVTERWHHSFDPFPDEGRTVPFGCGATVFYNYRDFQVTNTTRDTYQIRLCLTDTSLEGEVRVDRHLAYSYTVIEKEHAFLKMGERYYRKNSLWRNRIPRFSDGAVDSHPLFQNFSRVMYTPESFTEVSVESLPEEERQKI